MLSSVEIKNFKAINKPGGLKLDNLAQVNYLVGENGSGKSSVLEYLYIKNTGIKDKTLEHLQKENFIIKIDKEDIIEELKNTDLIVEKKNL